MRSLVIFALVFLAASFAWGEAVPKRIFGAAYPRLAHLANIQGRVKLEATVSEDGTVAEVRLIAGHALLAPTATESLRRWVFSNSCLRWGQGNARLASARTKSSSAGLTRLSFVLYTQGRSSTSGKTRGKTRLAKPVGKTRQPDLRGLSSDLSSGSYKQIECRR